MTTSDQPGDEATGPSRPGGPDGPGQAGQRRPGHVAFLLAQVGAQAAARFAERVSAFDVLPADVGVLRMVAGEPGRSQQSLAHELGVVASRVVALVDNLEGKGLLERRRSPRDRRHYELHLTPAGTTVMARIGALRAAHEDDICAALDEDERGVLMTMLEAIAAQQGLTTGVHPGYRSPAGRR